MKSSPSARSRSLRSRRCGGRRRQGNTFTFAVVAVAVVAALSLTGWWVFGRGVGEEGPDLILNTVSRGPYDFVVIEQGTVESATNTELRCEVRARGGGGGGGSERGGGSSMGGSSTTIMWVIPEGTMVTEGEKVVELDSASLVLEESSQKIRINSQESLVVQAENTLKAASIARTEYLEGLFVQQEQAIKVQLFAAERAEQTAMSGVTQAKALAAKGIVTALQVEASQSAYDNAMKQREVAETSLETLRKYTKEKVLTELNANIATAEAKVGAERSSLALERQKLLDIQDQIAKCTIVAPSPGQVVYANRYDGFRGSSSQAEFVVTEGAMVRERQAIIRLPNANDMQVKATVNEARVTLVRPGLPVSIRVDALKDEIIEGVVTKVNQYAEAGGFSSGNIKKYATFVKIQNPPAELRSGMNAEVRIHVETKKDALQVPVQALAEVKGHFFSLVRNRGNYETREVFISSTNDKVATIEKGLLEGDEVVMNPRGAGSLLVLPVLADPAPAIAADIQRTDGGPVTLAVATPGIVPPGAPVGGGPGGGGPGGPGGEGGGKKKGSGMTSASLLAGYLESDADKDGRLSQAELASMDERRRRGLADADKNSDGVLDDSELKVAAAAALIRMRERMNQGGGGERGGRRGDGQPGGGGPAGGAE